MNEETTKLKKTLNLASTPSTPPTQPHKHRVIDIIDIAERYFSIWSKQRDAARKNLLEGFVKAFEVETENDLFAKVDRQLATNPSLLSLDGSDSPNSGIRVVYWTIIAMRERKRAMSEYFAATFLFSSIFPIALIEEAPSIADMSNNDIKNKIPPVAVMSSDGRELSPLWSDKEFTPENTYVGVVGDTWHCIADLNFDAPDVFAEFTKLHEFTKKHGNFLGLSLIEKHIKIIEKTREFTQVFWKWYTSSTSKPKLQKSRQKGRQLPEGDYIQNPIEIVDRAAMRTIYANKNKLATTKSGRPYYRLQERGNRATVVCLPPEGKEVDDIAEYTAKVLAGLDDLTADVLKILCGYWKQFKDERGFCEVLASDVLNERDITPKTEKFLSKIYDAGHRVEDIDEINRCVQQLRGLRITVGTAIINGRKRKNPIIRKGYLLVVSEEFTHPGSERIYGWKFKFYDGLEDLVKNERFCSVYRKALTYDPLRRSPEKRISNFIDEGFRLNGNRDFNRRISTMFQDLNLPFDDKHPQDSIERIHLALSRLVIDGGLGDWGYVISKGKYTKKPTDPALTQQYDRKTNQKPTKREAYQNLTIRFFPPNKLPQIKRLASMNKRKK